MIFLKKNLRDDSRKKRTDAYEYTYVGSISKINCNVFRKLIQHNSRQTRQCKKNVVPSFRLLPLRSYYPKPHISRHKPKKQNLQRRKILQQRLCTNKRNSPEKNTPRRQHISPKISRLSCLHHSGQYNKLGLGCQCVIFRI